jgi:hypothetical protein
VFYRVRAHKINSEIFLNEANNPSATIVSTLLARTRGPAPIQSGTPELSKLIEYP